MTTLGQWASIWTTVTSKFMFEALSDHLNISAESTFKVFIGVKTLSDTC